MPTEAWVLEGASIGEGDEIPNSLAARTLLIQAALAALDTSDLAAINAATIAIQAVTDLIPDAGALTVPTADAAANTDWGDVIGNKEDVADETDDEASLVAINRKTLVEAHEVERHLHGDRRYWGALAAPDETNAIESNVNRPFVAISGNNDWGVAIPICGTDDNPAPLGTDTYFDPNYILVVDTDDATEYKFRSIYGTGTSGEAIAANQYTEEMFITAAGPFPGGVSVEIGHDRIPVGYKMWAQVWNVNNLSEVDFYWNAHGYPE